MSTWFKQVANNGLSYLNAQIEPLRHRQKFGKTSSEISVEIGHELQTTISREKDVERQIFGQEENRKKIRSSHQELNFRVQNLDENRQFLFKQTSDYECKLTKQAEKQKILLMNIDKLKTQLNDVEMIKLRSISLNLKGATELKEGTLIKIPKLQENKREIEKLLNLKIIQHREYSNKIDELSQKRDSLRNHLINVQKEHENLLNEQKKQQQQEIEVINNELIEVSQIIEPLKKRLNVSDLDEMTTIFDNEEEIKKEEEDIKYIKYIKYNKKEWQDRISQTVSIIHNLHCELNISEKKLESTHLLLGKCILQKINLERDLQRMQDMVQLQQETLESIENSRIEYSLQQQKYLKLRVNLQTKIDSLSQKLNNVKDEMKKLRDDICAIKEASNSLSQKKFDLANKLKKTIDKQHEIEDGLKILHRNRMSLRSRKSQLLKQQMSLQEESNKSTMKYITQNAKVIRCDCNIKGQLIISREYVEFITSEYKSKYNIKHEIIDISHSRLINYSSPTQNAMLLLYLNNRNNSDTCYKFGISQITDKNQLLLMHNFIETKRDLLDSIDNNKEKKKEQQKKEINTFSIWDIEIEDEFYCNCCSGFELREIISSCPSRTHIWKWKLFYSTAIHGISMNTLYANCENIDESILIIKDSINNIFGAYIDVEWTISTDYRGSIDCFVFKFIDKDKDDNKENNNDNEKKQDSKSKSKSKHKLIVYRSSGQKAYFMRNDMESITIGAGECPALYFDQDLNFGRSTNCITFDSQRLSKETQFQIQTLEIWAPNI